MYLKCLNKHEENFSRERYFRSIQQEIGNHETALQGLYFGKIVGYHKMISNRIKLQPQLYIPEVQVYTYLQICVGRFNFLKLQFLPIN